MSNRSRAFPAALLLVGGLLAVPSGSVDGQVSASLQVEENFRREPNGLILARLNPGASVRVLDRRDNWTQVELRGWVWLPSLQVSDDPDLELVVAAEGGENLRAEPSGEILARLVDGALLAELDRGPSWARVSRVGWVWTPSLSRVEGAGAPVSGPESGAPIDTDPGGEAGGGEGADVEGPAARSPGGFVGVSGGPILTAPDGDTLALTRPASEVQVVRREGSWARVRLEGWMWMPDATADGVPSPDAAGPVPLEPDEMAENPDAHAGKVVEWRLQFISLERAEEVRTDFFEGEPFLLTRFGSRNGPFVYVAVPTDRLTEVQGLLPLERIEVTGRVRTASSSLTGVPILDLIDFRRVRGQDR